jgi:hypothetical protein
LPLFPRETHEKILQIINDAGQFSGNTKTKKEDIY